jgi:hypothetical protein
MVGGKRQHAIEERKLALGLRFVANVDGEQVHLCAFVASSGGYSVSASHYTYIGASVAGIQNFLIRGSRIKGDKL